jgi:hypothetical protein
VVVKKNSNLQRQKCDIYDDILKYDCHMDNVLMCVFTFFCVLYRITESHFHTS